MEIAIILLVVIILGITIFVWYSMDKDSVGDKLITIAKVWGGIAVFILFIWFVVEVVSGWLLAGLFFLLFLFEGLFKK